MRAAHKARAATASEEGESAEADGPRGTPPPSHPLLACAEPDRGPPHPPEPPEVSGYKASLPRALMIDDVCELYVSLMCRFSPKEVLPFLTEHESYRPAVCLAACQVSGE